MKNLSLGLAVFLTWAASARDLGFRYSNGKCVNAQGQTGLNPGFIGPCADLNQVIINRFDFGGVDLSGAQFNAADLQDSSFKGSNLTGAQLRGANLAGADFASAVLHATDFSGSSLVNAHLAAADFALADLSGADFTGDLLSYLDFGGSKLQGAKFQGAIMDHVRLQGADLAGANLTGVQLNAAILDGAQLTKTDLSRADLTAASLQNISAAGAIMRDTILRQSKLTQGSLTNANLRSAQIDGAILNDADLTGTDIRGASLKGAKVERTIFTKVVYNPRTVLPFEASEAAALGMILGKGGTVLVIWDKDGGASIPDFIKLKQALEDAGSEVTLSPQSNAVFDGTMDLNPYSAVFHVPIDYQEDMPQGGQKALVDFVHKGGTYIGTQWSSYMVGNENLLTTMQDLVLFTYSTANADERKYSFAEGDASHPLLTGLVQGVGVNCEQATMKLRGFTANPAQVLVHDQSGFPMVAVRSLGAGKIVNFSWALHLVASSCFDSTTGKQLLLNAVTW